VGSAVSVGSGEGAAVAGPEAVAGAAWGVAVAFPPLGAVAAGGCVSAGWVSGGNTVASTDGGTCTAQAKLAASKTLKASGRARR